MLWIFPVFADYTMNFILSIQFKITTTEVICCYMVCAGTKMSHRALFKVNILGFALFKVILWSYMELTTCNCFFDMH